MIDCKFENYIKKLNRVVYDCNFTVDKNCGKRFDFWARLNFFVFVCVSLKNFFRTFVHSLFSAMVIKISF